MWFFGWFKKKKEASMNEGKKKIVLIVGHGDNGDEGATCFDKKTEYKYNLEVAKKVSEELGCEYLLRKGLGITGVGVKAVSKNPDLIIELHLNAFNGRAKGCEVLFFKGDIESSKYAKSFADTFSKKFSKVLRGKQGIVEISKKDRGGLSLSITSKAKASILVEPFFCDNKDDYVSIEDYSKFLIEWLKTI